MRPHLREGTAQETCKAVRRKIFLASEPTWCANAGAPGGFSHSAVAGNAALQCRVCEAAYEANKVLKRTRHTIDAQILTEFDNDSARYEMRFTLDPHAVYIEVLFRFESSSILADVGGAWVNPRVESRPGS